MPATQYLYLMDLTHQCPVTSLHKCKSHTVHQWINSCYYSCNCPQDQRWYHDKIIGGAEPERRSSSRFRVSGSLQRYLTLWTLKKQERTGILSAALLYVNMWGGVGLPPLPASASEGTQGMQLQVGLHHIPWLPDLSTWAIRTWQPKRRVRGSLPTACVSCLWNWYSWVLGSLLFVVKKLQRASCLPTQGQHGLWKTLQCLWL